MYDLEYTDVFERWLSRLKNRETLGQVSFAVKKLEHGIGDRKSLGKKKTNFCCWSAEVNKVSRKIFLLPEKHLRS